LGEVEQELAHSAGFRICQIVSGALAEPVEYQQDHDELALVVSGGAVLQAGDETLSMGAGDWVWLPSREAHRLISTEPGTVWLTVHGVARRAGN
jgi:cupin 2 domain-containing protein